jgi:hypothetical protein
VTWLAPGLADPVRVDPDVLDAQRLKHLRQRLPVEAYPRLRRTEGQREGGFCREREADTLTAAQPPDF